MTIDHIEELFIWLPAFLVSITFHEGAHAVTSLLLGDRTAEKQASLNPLPHIQQEPVGTLVAPVVSFFMWGWSLGWASAPYDPYWAHRNPRKAGLMSLAGPAANLLLATLSLGVIYTLLATEVIALNPIMTMELPKPPTAYLRIPDYLQAQGNLSYLAKFLSVLFVLNVLLCLFNLIPLPPLDGSGAVRGFFAGSWPARLLVDLEESGWQMVGLMAAWVIFSKLYPFVDEGVAYLLILTTV